MAAILSWPQCANTQSSNLRAQPDVSSVKKWVLVTDTMGPFY